MDKSGHPKEVILCKGQGQVVGYISENIYLKPFCPPVCRDEVLIFSGGGAASRRLPRICGT